MLLAVVMTALTGQGTMVEAAPTGGIRFVLCTADGMIQAVMTPDGRVEPADLPEPPDPCPWALAAQPALAAGGMCLVAPAMT